MGDASAQLLDDILLNPTKDGKVVAVISLSGRVQYLRHFPEKQGQHLEIYFKILADGSPVDLWQGYEARTAPPSDLIPGFVAAIRDVATEPKLVIDFTRPAEYTVRIGKNARSLVITIQSDKVQPAVEPQNAKSEPTASQPETKPALKDTVPDLPPILQAVPESATTKQNAAPTEAASAVPADASVVSFNKETDDQAEVLMVKARDALKLNKLGAAIEAFNKVLALPPNKYSQEAQEWIGNTRERAGQKFKAKLEYETYLKLYTTGDGVERVKARLAKLTDVQQSSQVAGNAEAPRDKKEFQTSRNGNLSTNYYHGNSLTSVSGSNTPATSITDQSALITSVSASQRWRNDRYDNRMVFQDTYNKNFLTDATQTNPNRLSTAYYDFRDNATSLSTRIGRQSPTGGGAMGRFDGISAGYTTSGNGVAPKIQITASTGRLSDYATGSKPSFYSLGLGLVNSARWGGAVYYVNQHTNGISDRSALGAEVRYFDTNKNAYSMVDYDTFFKVINTALLQGSFTDSSGASYNFSFDHRKSPSISLSNALIGSPSTMSVMLENGFTLDDLKALALLRTATSNSVAFGVNKPLTDKWQTGADISVSTVSGLPESGTNVPNSIDGYSPATPSSGNSVGINGRLIGNGIFRANDVSVFTLGYTSSLSSKGETFMFSNHLSWNGKLTTDTAFRINLQSSYDATTGDLTGKQTVISPTIRLGYQWKTNFSLEGDAGIDFTDNSPASGQSSRTTRKYFSMGGRWDF